MKIAIVGATGTAGAFTAAVAKNRGHEVVEISRSCGVDLHTGAGLARALAGAVAVIDTSNPVPASMSDDVVGAMSGATKRLVEACTAAGVEHLVLLSISNIDKPELDQFPYYLAKHEQERIVRDGPLSATIVRSTQWCGFATNPSAVAETDDAVEVQDWLIQPIAAHAVSGGVHRGPPGFRASGEASPRRPKHRVVRHRSHCGAGRCRRRRSLRWRDPVPGDRTRAVTSCSLVPDCPGRVKRTSV
jgi:nucleoside-diphosphate-sugar epimerase